MTLKNKDIYIAKTLDTTEEMEYNITIRSMPNASAKGEKRRSRYTYPLTLIDMKYPNQGAGFVPYFLTIEQVSQLLSLSRSTIDRRERIEKAFPERVKISKRRVGWRSDEIEDYAKGTWKGGKN